MKASISGMLHRGMSVEAGGRDAQPPRHPAAAARHSSGSVPPSPLRFPVPSPPPHLLLWSPGRERAEWLRPFGDGVALGVRMGSDDPSYFSFPDGPADDQAERKAVAAAAAYLSATTEEAEEASESPPEPYPRRERGRQPEEARGDCRDGVTLASLEAVTSGLRGAATEGRAEAEEADKEEDAEVTSLLRTTVAFRPLPSCHSGKPHFWVGGSEPRDADPHFSAHERPAVARPRPACPTPRFACSAKLMCLDG